MAFVKKTRYLLAPPYCRSAETFISPILSSPSEVLDGLNVGDKIVAEGTKKVRPNLTIKPIKKN